MKENNELKTESHDLQFLLNALNIQRKRAAIDSGLSTGLISEYINGIEPTKKSTKKKLERYIDRLTKQLKKKLQNKGIV